MSDITLVVLCAGESTRFELSVKKQWIRIEDKPLWLHVTDKLSSFNKKSKLKKKKVNKNPNIIKKKQF